LHTNDFERDHEPPKLLLEVGTHTHPVVENSTKTHENERKNKDDEQDPLILLGI
jgi:hypothetical protein